MVSRGFGQVAVKSTQLFGLNPPTAKKRASPSDWHAYGGVDFVSMYISRGQVYSSKASIQPWWELYTPITDNHPDDIVNEVGLFVLNWNSLQGGRPGLDQPVDTSNAVLRHWYEADLDAGVQAKLLGHITTQLRFNYYTSPSGSFGDIQEIDWRVGYSNPKIWKPIFGAADFTLNPHLRVAKETRDLGGREKFYIEPSLTPTFRLPGLCDKLTVSVPLVLGFGADGQYYNAERQSVPFGYFETGIGIAYPLDVLPQGGGKISLTAGFNVVIAGNKTLTFWNSRVLPVGHMGLTYSF